MVRGLLPPAEIEAARAELEAMALSDRPDCELIWYEGALREHLELDASRDRASTARSARPASSPARKATACRPSSRACAPATCASS